MEIGKGCLLVAAEGEPGWLLRGGVVLLRSGGGRGVINIEVARVRRGSWLKDIVEERLRVE